MAKFRKKPVVIEAMQWHGANIEEVLAFAMTGPCPLWGDDFKVNKEASAVSILTSEGVMTASLNDWIIRGVKGEFYPCKPDIFEATYQPVDVRDEEKPLLGLATTRELLAEISARIEMGGGIGRGLDYRTVDSD